MHPIECIPYCYSYFEKLFDGICRTTYALRQINESTFQLILVLFFVLIGFLLLMMKWGKHRQLLRWS